VYLYLLPFLAFLASCKLEEGKGAKGEISGKVIVQVLYSNPILGIKDSVIKSYPAVDQRVYVNYGDNSIYDDDFRTDQNGGFKFTELTKGSYSVTVYSYCDTCDTEVTPITKKITLDKHDSKLEVPTFYIQEEQ
jgi:hypothetical protein